MSMIYILVYMLDIELMKQALTLAENARGNAEVPIGALVCTPDGIVIGTGHNVTRTNLDPSGHAEIVSLRNACQNLGKHRLDGCTLYVTLEPCAMCAQAIAYARIARLVYGAEDPKGGAVAHGAQIFAQPTCHHKIKINSGIMREECGAILRHFFKIRR